MTGLEGVLVRHLERVGTIGFDEYVGHALYAPGLGFYSGGGGAGRRRDFLTSPEVGPLFGAVLARALDAWWDEMGRPDPFHVVEGGAGPGTLARTVLAASPRCAGALRLTLVEPADVQWSTHPAGVASRPDLPPPALLGGGPVVVLANELLDNLPFALVELTTEGWCEVRVGLRVDGAQRPPGSPEGPSSGSADGGDAGRGPLVEVLEPLDEVRARWCDARAAGRASVGSRLPVQADAAGWVSDALDLAAGGRVVVVDYADRTPSLASRPWRDWLRTYAGHGRGGHPLSAPGSCDITCEVAVDQLELVRPPAADRDQATFLRAHGIDDLVEEGRRRWAAGGPAGGLDALAARSRIHEAEALSDPSGLGAFRVLEWVA